MIRDSTCPKGGEHDWYFRMGRCFKCDGYLTAETGVPKSETDYSNKRLMAMKIVSLICERAKTNKVAEKFLKMLIEKAKLELRINDPQ